ncbi:hypothetical protein [Stratiformator vulcanicus]|uniref:Immunity protein 30 domain-containing protein n=1 Tax=Stratiformator vulcanicus TaxID=2527980 RepID=A0A517QXG8_9PLAN|nr:hypothetical protein [Stratiformator vulcanicus]QDT36283.1 hypothetical protein Pan189_06390 [Stratiformator vulcanicus]
MKQLATIITEIQEIELLSQDDIRPEQLADELAEQSDICPAVGAILRLFERHPQHNFGAPGPLVHEIERCYGSGYEAELQESLNRKPTRLTVWLANRIVNAKDKNHGTFLRILHAIAENKAADSDVRTDAKNFLELHAEHDDRSSVQPE